MTRYLLIASMAWFLGVVECPAELAIGDTRDGVIEELGEPEARVRERGRETLHYGRSTVTLAHGVVAGFDPDVEKEAQRIRTARPQQPAPVVTPPPRPAPQVKAGIPTVQLGKAKRAKPGKGASGAGARIDLKNILVPGKVTIVDFYADWCGPCRRIAPLLESMARDDRDVHLHKVDIVRWGTEVTKQFSIRSIPHIRVYDRTGKMVGQPTSNLKAIRQHVQRAK